MKSEICFDKSVKPNKRLLADALGISYKRWEQLKGRLEEEYGPLVEEWKYYGQKLGWTMKLLRRKRNLFFFAPCDKFFRIAFVFGDKAINVITGSNLPKTLIHEVVTAKKYAEGRGLRIDVKNKTDVEHIIALVKIKIEH